jgi:hypothetical protein
MRFRRWLSNAAGSPLVQRRFTSPLLLAILALATCSMSYGQSNQVGSIHGQVTDTTGAVIAGVKVALTSPALLVPQEATSDAGGNYHFVELPLGTYTMAFSETGFDVLTRENIGITAGFSAEVNVQLTVGSLTQEVTVTAAGPVVDTSSTTATNDLQAQTLAEELPVTRTLGEVVSTTPGITPTQSPDLGGGVLGDYTFNSYGFTGQITALIEGINTRMSSGQTATTYDMTTLDELQVVPTGGNAEVTLPSVYMNAIVKTGGNSYHGRFEVDGETQSLESNNLTAAIRAQGTTIPNIILNTEDLTADFGGPIKRDKWWFFAGGHLNRGVRNIVGYTGLYDGRQTHYTGKTTYQLNKSYKLIGFYSQMDELFPQFQASALRPFQNTASFTINPTQWKGEIQGTPTSNLVVDFFAGHNSYSAIYTAQPDPSGIPDQIDLATQILNGPTLGEDHRPRSSWQQTGSVSYLHGGHELKFGSTWMEQYTGTNEPNGEHGNYELVFNNGNPVQIKTFNYPLTGNREDFTEGGAYAEDTWRINRQLTLNLGLRWDHFHSWVPAQDKPAGMFGAPWNTSVTPATGAAQSFPKIDAGSWNEPAPRIGLAWNIKGDGKTVLKLSYGRYNWTPADDYAAAYNVDIGTITTYKWTGPCPTPGSAVGCDYAPGTVNLDPNGPAFLSVTGASNGGTSTYPNTAQNPNLHEQYTSEFQGFVEREIGPGISARVGYTYAEDLNQWEQIPIQVPYSAWNTPYVVHDAGPKISPTLTNTTGPAFTIYDLNPAFKGTAFSQTEYLNRPSNRTDIFKTLEFTVTKHPSSSKWSVLASYTATKEHQWLLGGTGNLVATGVGASQNAIFTSPNQTFFPLNTTWAWQAHASANYVLPGKLLKLDTGATLEIFNGLQGQRTDTWILPNSTVTIPIEPFGAETGPLRTLLNLRFARDFKTEKHGTFRPSVDLLNVFNAAAPWTINYVTGPTFGKYTSIDTPRILKGSLVYSF